MGGTDLQPREHVQRAFENQMRERDRRLERVADDVLEPAAAFQALIELHCALRMEKDEDAELFGFSPEDVKLRVGEFVARAARANGRPAQAELLHRMLELLRCELRKLQRHGGERDETVRVLAAKLRELLVVQAHDLARRVAIGLVPDRIDAERLDVDVLLVHRLHALFGHDDDALLVMLRGLDAEHVHRFRDDAVRMHVDRLHTAALHDDFAPPRSRLRRSGSRAAGRSHRFRWGMHCVREIAAREENALERRRGRTAGLNVRNQVDPPRWRARNGFTFSMNSRGLSSVTW